MIICSIHGFSLFKDKLRDISGARKAGASRFSRAFRKRLAKGSVVWGADTRH